MSISLFEHNQAAYNAAVAMLAETGKAAIVHPTGTGKSFIGFKLCEDNPDALICWLSPSEYIFKTQLENLAATGADVPENIAFYTYAKLMLMTDDEINEIRPDHIILDEFHRCGAEMWGQGVQNLLDAYPEAPILGLSATNIRYLDNQRDMADELFDGNIASQMTLGEALVRGILRTPKYITALYSYQKSLEKYEARIRSAQNKAVRREGEQKLEALRRALEKAEGLDRIFEKHIADKTGKYIVFCADKEHMDEMVSHVPEWFARVDSRPHVYTAYASDPETSKAFAEFKKDSSAGLKLLFAIDMLNEGVHVDDISGVILFRPTVSPIIFKQQIGRALCTGKERSAVILDLVDNISNLYSIGAIEEEMQAAVTYYHYLGQYEKIVNESFEVIDEVRDCKRLFDELEETLALSWGLMFLEAAKYRRENGDLLIQRRYVTDDGLPLGQWVHTQRRAYWGTVRGRLSEEQIEKLNGIDMVWDRYSELSWERYYDEARKYYEANGNLKIPYDYETGEGLPLGEWIARQRQYRSSRRNSALTEERIRRLDEIGMRWDAISFQWEENYQEAVSYYKEHGDLMVPSAFISEKGIKLGQWISRLRRIRSGNSSCNDLSEEQIDRLNRIGMVWDVEEASWMAAYERAESYYKANGNLAIPRDCKSSDGYTLGQWVGKQRDRQSSGELAADRKAMLDKIGMRWENSKDQWMRFYSAAEDHYRRTGHLNIPQGYVTPDGLKLGVWLSNRKKSKDSLSPEKIAALEAIGIQWESKYDISWREKYNAVKRYYDEHGDIQIPYNYISEEGFKLNAWLATVRIQYRNKKLSQEQILALERLGMLWNVFDDKWMQHYGEAERFYRDNGHLNTSRAEHPRLDAWLCTQRRNRDTLLPERRRLLDDIHMCWEDAAEARWLESFEIAKAYYFEHENLLIPAAYVTDDGKKLGSWVFEQRRKWRKGKLPDEHYSMLSEIGMVWALR